MILKLWNHKVQNISPTIHQSFIIYITTYLTFLPSLPVHQLGLQPNGLPGLLTELVGGTSLLLPLPLLIIQPAPVKLDVPLNMFVLRHLVFKWYLKLILWKCLKLNIQLVLQNVNCFCLSVIVLYDLLTYFLEKRKKSLKKY